MYPAAQTVTGADNSMSVPKTWGDANLGLGVAQTVLVIGE
jgi:hypothetical protein